MSELSNKKNAPHVTESLGNSGLARRPGRSPRPSPSGSGPSSAVQSWLSSYTYGSAGSPGPYFVRVPKGPSDPPMLMKVVLITWTTVIIVGLAGRHLLLHRQALAAGTANHARRHAAGGLRAVVFPGSAAELLQHLEHVQHVDVEPGLMGAAHSGLGVVREPGRMMAEPFLMNAPGYSYGVLLCTILGCWVMRRAKAALAEHQQHRV